MLITLSHCVVVRTFLVGSGAADGGSAATDGGSAGFACAMMLCASIRAFLCSARAILVLSAIALPAATRFGFFCFVAGVFEVTCMSAILMGVFEGT